MHTPWESDLTDLLTRLSAAQEQSLEILAKKRELLASGNVAGLEALGKEEEQVIHQLQECLKQREAILQRAGRDGLPADSIQALAASLSGDADGELAEGIRQARLRARLLQHHSLTNWVLVQRTLLHLSQMLEIVATGGRLQPTYGRGEAAAACGALVDRAA